jgi:hypothetical protein
MQKYLPYIVVGSLGSMLGWFSIRLYAQKYILNILMKEYDALPAIGPILVTANSNYVVFSVDRYAVEMSTRNLLKEYLPAIGYNIPSEASLVEFLSYKLSVPTGVPQDKVAKLLEEIIVYAKSKSDEEYAKEKANILLAQKGMSL